MYADLGAHLVMQITEEEKAAAAEEEASLADINRLVDVELDRQAWRGEMAKKAYEMYKSNKSSTAIQDVAAAEQGIGQPLPPIQRDAAFKQGGWIASAAQQRRALTMSLDALEPGDVQNYQPYWVLRAGIAEASGDRAAARSFLERGIGLTEDAAVRRFLLERLGTLAEP